MLMPKITPFLWFNDTAETAANFYCTVFPNSKLGRISRQGPGGPVMVVAFELDGKEFIALNGGPQFKFTEAVSFVIHCETQEEVDHYWEKLTADGGAESRCGWLKDKFGLSWQVVPNIMSKLMSDKDPAKVGRVMQALMQMGKLEIAGLQRAYDQG
jgi:predicted 3-demethylubiquinone-9 3-methyltransferase (glyoxalase superfamily)